MKGEKKVLQEVNLCHIIKNTKGGKNQIKSSMKTSSTKSINWVAEKN